MAHLSFYLGDTAFWVPHDMKDGTAYYFHLQTFQGTWERPPSRHLNASHLTWEEIQVGRVPARVGALYMGRGSLPQEDCCLHSQSSPRSPRPTTASCSGRPTLALSSSSRLAFVASSFARSLLSLPTSSGPCCQPSSRSRYYLGFPPGLERSGLLGIHLPPLPWLGFGWFLDLWAVVT